MREPKKTNLGPSPARRWWRGAWRREAEHPRGATATLIFQGRWGALLEKQCGLGWNNPSELGFFYLSNAGNSSYFTCLSRRGHTVDASCLLSFLFGKFPGVLQRADEPPSMPTLRMAKAGDDTSKPRAWMSRKYPSRSLKPLLALSSLGFPTANRQQEAESPLKARSLQCTWPIVVALWRSF